MAVSGKIVGIRTHPATCRWPVERIHISTSPSLSGLFLTSIQLGEVYRRRRAERAYLVRKGQRELDLVRGDIGVASAGKRSGESSRADAQSGAGDTEGVHDERRSSE
jgi:hypothetical protein